MRNLPLALLAAALVTVNLPAEAYIGPGAGISLLGAFWALILAVGGAIGVVVWYPLRNLFRRRRATPRPAPTTGEASEHRHRPA